MTIITQNSVVIPQIRALRCLRCGTVYPQHAIAYTCSCRLNVGSDLGTLTVEYDYAAVQQRFTDDAQLGQNSHNLCGGIARYTPLLPIVDTHALTPLAVGGTPLLAAPRLAKELTISNLFIKDDGRNPSGSLKDRASAIAVSRARSAGVHIVATASTGNAAAALASQCAAVGQANVIFVPQSAPQAKIAQLLAYGSLVIAIDGTYDQAFDLCIQACEAFGWYNRNTGYNPYMTEGKKTVSFEIAEQLAAARRPMATADSADHLQFAVPDAIFVSVGDGCIIGGVHKGFQDLLALGWIDHMPRIYGVQSAQSDAIYQAWRNDWELPRPIQATTRADSISVNEPRDAVKALRAVRETGGAYLAVPDQAILDAILPMARLGGVFAEPAGATALAGLAAAVTQKLIQPHETIVLINTGSGLKDVPAVIQVTGGVETIAPTLDAVYDVTHALMG
ncbi:MAG: threonine synthase [Caldilineaceae bacterium]